MTALSRLLPRVRFVAALVAFLLAFLALGGPHVGVPVASAQERPVPGRPSDVPQVGPGEAVIPPVPSTFRTRDLGWLQISFPPEATERLEPVLREANAFKGDLESTLGQPVLEHVQVRITSSTEEMARLAPVGSPPPAYASGVAYTGLHLVLISMFAPGGVDGVDLEQVFRHEMSHVALEDATLGQHVPVWFNEGLAVGLAGENQFDRQNVLARATVYGNLLPLDDLDRSFPRDHAEVGIAYAESADVLRFLMRRTDHVRFTAMIRRVREGQPFDRALGDAYGSDLRKLEFQWRTEAERRYSIFPILAGGGIMWVAVIGALGWGWVKKRRRAKAILARWATEDALEDALLARRAAEAAEESDRDLARLSMRPPRAPTKFEHDGDWHTLH
ncbi:MAG: hypothetical protein JWP97_947 [Labilithrix sp.]|nr:hypothetical protein [Labilithrix sp.]